MLPRDQSSRKDETSSQSISVSGSQVSGVNINQAGRDALITDSSANSDKQNLQQEDVILLLDEIKALLSAADIAPAEKQMSTASVELAQQEAKKEEPNKSFIAELVKRATQASNDATNAIDAGSGLWNKAKPIVEKLLPYLGVGLTFFA
ncbi:MAG: hypothetical protein ACFB0D_04230 [Phormidesmis sp.]